MRRHAREGWRTNIAQGGRGEVVTVKVDEERLALAAAKAVGADAAGVDLLPGTNGEWYALEALAPVTGVEMVGFVAGAFSAVTP